MFIFIKWRHHPELGSLSHHSQRICSQTMEIRMDDQMIGAERINKFNFRYSLGESLSLNCSSEATLPPANLTWYINQKPVQKSSISVLGFTYFLSTIRFPPISSSNTRSSTWLWGGMRLFTRRCWGSDAKSWGKIKIKAFREPGLCFPSSSHRVNIGSVLDQISGTGKLWL